MHTLCRTHLVSSGMMDYHNTHVLLHGLLHWSFILRADQALISSTRVLLTGSTVLYVSCNMLAAQLFLVSQHMIHSVHSTHDIHCNQGVTCVRYFIYGDNKIMCEENSLCCKRQGYCLLESLFISLHNKLQFRLTCC